MALRAASVLFVANAVLPYYTLDNRMSSVMSEAHDVSFDEVHENSYCMHTIDVKNSADEELRSLQCHELCSGGAHTPECADYDPVIDGPGESSLCATPEKLFALCGRLETCWGVTHNTGLNHGYLNTYACAADAAVSSAEGRDVYVKKVSAPFGPGECPLGVGVEVLGAGHTPEVAGLYQESEDKESFFQVEPEQFMSKITFHSSGCGWVVSENLGNYKPPVVEPATVCPDDNVAASLAFGMDGDAADETICATAGSMWGEGSYCKNAVFAALCPGSCMIGCGDNDVALMEYWGYVGLTPEMFGADAFYCERDVSEEQCEDPMLGTICRATCGWSDGKMRRLSADHSALKEMSRTANAKLKGKFRALMADFRLNALAKSGARRLGIEPGYTEEFVWREVYYTFDPLPIGKTCNITGGGGDPTNFTSRVYPAMYDVKGWYETAALGISLTCEPQKRYVVEYPEQFCSRTNIPAPFNEEPMIVNNACYKKCTLATASGEPSYNSSVVDGVNDYCAGNRPEFTNFTNALCLPREKCEELCTLLGDECESFDMHRKYPLCYLNRNECSAGGALMTPNVEWDVILKTTTPDETTNAVEDHKRDNYTTYTGLLPVGGIPPNTDTALSRSDCELRCSTVYAGWCTGFVYETGCPVGGGASCTAGNGQCSYLNETAAAADGSAAMVMTFMEYSTDSGATPQLDTQTVWRNVHKKCVAEVGACADGIIPGGAESPSYFYQCADWGFPPWGAATPGVPDCHVMNDVIWMDPMLMGAGYEYTKAELEAIRLACPVTCSVCKPGMEMEAVTTFGGPYLKLENISNVTFLRADNSTRLRYVENGTTPENVTFECDGWIFEKNGASKTSVTMYNCSDSHEAANDVLELIILDDWTERIDMIDDGNGSMIENVTRYRPFVGRKEFPCQYGSDNGFCSASNIFAGVCAHTCSPLDSMEIAGGMYFFQNLTKAGPCFGDDNDAAASLFTYFEPSLTGGSSCGAIATHADLYTFEDSPCHGKGKSEKWSLMFQVLCKLTCSNTTLPAADEVVAIQYDEAHPAGAQYPDRRLAAATLSHSGGSSGEIVVEYLDGLADDAEWEAVYASWRNGSSNDAYIVTYDGVMEGSTKAALATMGVGPVCTQGEPLAQPQFATISYAQFYDVAVEADPKVSMKNVCREVKLCPELTTCVLSKHRFDEELSRFRIPGVLDKAEFASTLSPEAMDTAMKGFVPRTIVSEIRAEAYLTGTETSKLQEDIGRSVPGATRMSFGTVCGKDIGVSALQFGTATVATLVSSTAAHGSYGLAELGYNFADQPLGPEWSGPYTDVIRLERFGADDKTPFTFAIYAPGTHDLEFFKFPHDGSAPEMVGMGTEICEGWFSITLPYVGGDFIGVTDVKECAADPCHPHAECIETIGGKPICKCHDGFSGDGVEACVLNAGAGGYGEWKAKELDSYYLKLDHIDRLDFGWRVKEIMMYTITESGEKVAIPADVRMSFMRSDDMTEGQKETYDAITEKTRVYSGEYAHSHYPGDPWDQRINGNVTESARACSYYLGSRYCNSSFRHLAGQIWWCHCL
jgi:hypothetical protein